MRKIFFKIKNPKVFIPLVFFSFITLFLLSFSLTKFSDKNNKKDDKVLGASYTSPEIYFYNYGESNKGEASGGVISLSTSEAPTVGIGGYNVGGESEIEIYASNEDALLDYMMHDDKNMQTKKKPDSNKIKYITTIKKNITSDRSSKSNDILLPISGKGIWYLKIKLSNISADAFVVRSDNGTLVKEGDDEFVFWGQNFKTKKNVTDGVVIVYNLQNGRRELQRSSFDAEGIAKAKLTKDADVAMVAVGDDRAIIPLNLQYINYGYSYQRYTEKLRKSRYFIFTDRPIYKPGDVVNFKAIVRDDDDARYTVPSGNVSVKIYGEYYDSEQNKLPVYEQNMSLTSTGAISGSYKIPEDGKTGYYTLSVETGNPNSASYYDDSYSSNYISFMVQYYKKPEFFLDVTSNVSELIAGDNLAISISGNYFSGQPMAKEGINYYISSGDYYDYSYLSDAVSYSQSLDDDYRYWYTYDNSEVEKGDINLDKNGKAVIKVDTNKTHKDGQTQVFSVDVSTTNKSRTPAYSHKNILVYAGEFGIFRKDYSYGSKINEEFALPIKLLAHKNGVNLNEIDLNAKITRHDWNVVEDKNSKYPKYIEVKENLPSIKAKTNESGEAQLKFTPTKTGSYTITVEAKDNRGNLITKNFYAYFSKDDYPYYSEKGNSELTLSSDKQKYLPNETAKINVYSYLPNRDVFLNFQRGRLDRYKVLHLEGKSGSFDIPLIDSDMPNTYVHVSSFDDNSLNSNSISIPVSTEGKKISVKITPDLKKYGPGETVNLNIKTTDSKGNPVSTELAVWAVDKAIFELTESRLGDIFKTFWNERSDTTLSSHSLEGIRVNSAEMGGGCFLAGTKILMANGKTKNIEDVREGDYVYTRAHSSASWIKAKVTKTTAVDDVGYMIINGKLRVTPDHIIMLNGFWQIAGNAQAGDKLTDSEGKKVLISSVEYIKNKAKVYNLAVENYHSFFADNVWVHNEKGADREEFKDTAYWNPTVITNDNGDAQVSFKLPDDLTTWTIAGVASTLDTKAGQTTTEITTTKDVIVRPILPNILRTGDEIELAAIVQNFTDSPQNFNVTMSFDSGTIEKPNFQNVKIESGDSKEFKWKVKPNKANDASKIIISAKVIGNDKLVDNLTQQIPVIDFGFQDKNVEVGEGNKNYPIKLSKHTNNSKTKISLQLSSSLLTMVPGAMKYLVEYPYGCVEQTTSRFVPAIIARKNQDLYSEALKGKDINKIIETGIQKLEGQQASDGGWAWWGEGDSSPFVSAYVIEYLLEAKKLGYKIDGVTLDNAKRFIERKDNYENKDFSLQDLVMRNYALTLLGEGSKVSNVNMLDSLTPDLLSYHVMTNYLNGNKDPKTNGLNRLESLANSQGDSVYWEAGTDENFGSNEASTALAVRAITLAGGNTSLASRGVKFLVKSKRYDYWANTFATAQIVAAATDFSRKEESDTNYSYSVILDGNTINQGVVVSSKQNIPEISVPTSLIKENGSTLSVKKSGKGQLYSTFVLDAFNTNRSEKALDHGIKITRDYHNADGETTLKVGDTALISLTVSGLETDEDYAVIHDELPAGLVPVNETLNNEYVEDKPDYYSYSWYGKEFTQNGVFISMYRVGPGSHTYTYKARVVSQGDFIVPPATVSLMYSPEIYGRTKAEVVNIPRRVSIFAPASFTNTDLASVESWKKTVSYFGGIIILISLFVATYLFKNNKKNYLVLKEKVRNKLKKHDKLPPPQNPQELNQN